MNKNDDKVKDRSEELNANQELNTMNLEATEISAEKELSGDRQNPHREQQSRKDDEFEENIVEE